MNMNNFLSRFLAATAVFIIAGVCSVSHAGEPVLVNHGPAPEFSGIATWQNSPPLSMQALKGKVVLIDFWTYSCINCVRTLPYIKKWHDKYKDQGLVIVGVHTPEFAFERKTNNVQTAMKRFGIQYAVAQDNEYATWKAYENQYWPAAYLIDRSGTIVLKHFGEGRYDEMEKAIQTLISARGGIEGLR
jgi:thiol-disulfide isomerase/thioredoxin